MTVGVSDSVLGLGSDARASFEEERLGVLLYADDTLIMGDNPVFVQQLLDAIATAGAKFGRRCTVGSFSCYAYAALENWWHPMASRYHLLTRLYIWEPI